MRCLFFIYGLSKKQILFSNLFISLLYCCLLTDSQADCHDNNNISFSDSTRKTYRVSGALIEKLSKKKKKRFFGFTIIAYEVYKDEKKNVFYRVKSNAQKVTTNNEGTFTFELYADTEYLIKCIKPGYFSDEIPLPKRNIALGQHISLEINVKKSNTAIVAGYIKNFDTNDIESDVKVILKNSDSGILRSMITEKDGAYSFEVLEGSQYEITANKEHFFESDVAKTSYKEQKEGIIKKDIYIKGIAVGKAYRLDGFYFGVNEYHVNERQAESLLEAVDILKNNPDIQFEVGCFSDARGDDEYNLNLTQLRAEAIVTHLVKEHKITSDRLIAVGYGENRLLNECNDDVLCATEKHEENRRIELIIVKILE